MAAAAAAVFQSTVDGVAVFQRAAAALEENAMPATALAAVQQIGRKVDIVVVAAWGQLVRQRCEQNRWVLFGESLALLAGTAWLSLSH